MNVLHIDDSPEICKLYFEYYTRKNHSVTSVLDGEKGLELVLKNDYDLILLDMCMPKYGGMNFLYDLKLKRPSELKKIIVTTVLSFTEDQIRGLKEYGIRDVKEKPAHIQKLDAIMKEMSEKGEDASGYLKKMLIIDDNPETTKMLLEFFRYEGFETVSTNDPWDGLRRIREERFDVILLDLMIPEFSGSQIIATLASEEILEHQNIFIYSANCGTLFEKNEFLRKDGISGCIDKPMNLHDMLKLIREKSTIQKTLS
ncbi:MAG: response regulator [Nitrosopumilaceae archaeon]|nr:response regulator [Nitrosopumilaceae archaeon]